MARRSVPVKRFYLDTEFNERPGLLDLISIGLVDQDNCAFYAVSSEFDGCACNDWVLTHVIPNLGQVHRETRVQIRERLLVYLGDGKEYQPELYGYFADYDWVLFCWLFGTMVDLPKHLPMFCLDIHQTMHERKIKKSQLPPESKSAHHALIDAQWIKAAHEEILRLQGQADSR